jgi:hypothetical protein
MYVGTHTARDAAASSATTFEIEDADGCERARIVANTDDPDRVLPELDIIVQQLGTMGSGVPERKGSSDDGRFGAIADALGFDDGKNVDEERRAERVELGQAYAEALQTHLEEHDLWEEIVPSRPSGDRTNREQGFRRQWSVVPLSSVDSHSSGSVSQYSLSSSTRKQVALARSPTAKVGGASVRQYSRAIGQRV